MRCCRRGVQRRPLGMVFFPFGDFFSSNLFLSAFVASKGRHRRGGWHLSDQQVRPFEGGPLRQLRWLRLRCTVQVFIEGRVAAPMRPTASFVQATGGHRGTGGGTHLCICFLTNSIDWGGTARRGQWQIEGATLNRGR